ncbi:uncharacterized protein LOC133193633 [Saccostrea echinata]|uniref:uncharacterized protein LOC133193633 n=1 Tax=Saccostrea echinata TaxID=191078 RepID=UPI002A808F1C|nr:uncharacterized protein LOC133193633 [Saccostrea echinata]
MLPAVKILVLVVISNICLAPFINGRMFRRYQYGSRSMFGNQRGYFWKPSYTGQYYLQFLDRKFTTDDEYLEEGSGSGSGDGKSDMEDLTGLIITPKIKPIETTFDKIAGVSDPVPQSQSTIPPSKETKKISTTSKIPDTDRSSNSEKTQPAEVVTESNPSKPFPKNRKTQVDSSLGAPAKEEGEGGLSQQAIYIIVGSTAGGVVLVLLIAMVVVRLSRRNVQDGYRHNLM